MGHGGRAICQAALLMKVDKMPNLVMMVFRMKRIVTILCLSFLIGCSAVQVDPWAKADMVREVVYLGVKAIDYGQTMTIANNPDKYYEYNPILGDHPSPEWVTSYFISTAVAHFAIAYVLPSKYRKWWQYTFMAGSAGLVIHNKNMGIGLFK